MEPTPIVSVIIVSWNTRDLLRQALRSVFACEVPLEVFVVDNASEDGTVTMIQREFPYVKLIENRLNLGFSRANNQAMRECTAEFVLLLNPDATLEPGALTTMLGTMQGAPDAAVVGPKVLDADGAVNSTRRRFPTAKTLFLESTVAERFLTPDHPVLRSYYVLDRSDNESQKVDWLNGACLLVRGAAIDAVGMLDERYFMYFEEADWCREFHEAGWTVHYDPMAVARHLGGKSSDQAPTRRHCTFNESKCLYARKWHGLLIGLSLRWFLFATSWIQLGEESIKLALGHKRELRRARVAMWADVLRWQAARLFTS